MRKAVVLLGNSLANFTVVLVAERDRSISSHLSEPTCEIHSSPTKVGLRYTVVGLICYKFIIPVK